MVWEPFAIAVVFGLVVSAGLYFIVMWPQVEPDDDLDDDDEPAPPALVDINVPAAAVVITDPVITDPVITDPVITGSAVTDPSDDDAPPTDP